eukprot:1184179-Prorocentrum_minimum.AAC.18
MEAVEALPEDSYDAAASGKYDSVQHRMRALAFTPPPLCRPSVLGGIGLLYGTVVLSAPLPFLPQEGP